MRGRIRRFEGGGFLRRAIAGFGIRGCGASLVIPVAGLLDNWVLSGQIGVIGWCGYMRLVNGKIWG